MIGKEDGNESALSIRKTDKGTASGIGGGAVRGNGDPSVVHGNCQSAPGWRNVDLDPIAGFDGPVFGSPQVGWGLLLFS